MTTATLPTQEQVDRIAQELAPEVVSIGFRVGRDWSNDPAIYFRVVLSDEASRQSHLGATAIRIQDKLYERLNLLDSGYLPYFSFRSQSEQAKVQDDPRWD